MNLRDLFLRIRALVAPHRVERELHRGAHVPYRARDAEAHHRWSEPRPARARRSRASARCRLPPTSIATLGHRLVDDLARDILYAFRTFRRAPLAALTIVATVALGLGLITVVFTVYNTFFLRVDPVQTPGSCLPWSSRQPPARIVAAVHAG